jgi:hypothetical protein
MGKHRNRATGGVTFELFYGCRAPGRAEKAIKNRLTVTPLNVSGPK